MDIKIFLCYTIPFSTMNRFDSSDIVIHDSDPIEYHRDVFFPLNLQEKDLESLWD